MTIRRLTLEVDDVVLFDAIARMGDSGAALGSRVVGTLLAGTTLRDELGMSVYGVTVVSDKPATSLSHEQDIQRSK